MWLALGEPADTFDFENLPSVLDKFLVNKNMADDAALRLPPRRILRYRPGSSLRATGDRLYWD